MSVTPRGPCPLKASRSPQPHVKYHSTGVCVRGVCKAPPGRRRRRAGSEHSLVLFHPPPRRLLAASVGAVCRAEAKKCPVTWQTLLCQEPPLRQQQQQQQQCFPQPHSHLYFHFSLPARPGREGSQQAGGDGDVNCMGRGRNLAAPGQTQHF